MLRDLDAMLLPGVTHWQHPRYFAYFPSAASEPGDPRRDARRDAQRGRVPVAHRARGDRARGRRAPLGRRICSGCPRAGTATSRTRPRPRRWRRSSPRVEATGRERDRLLRADPLLGRKAARMLGMRLRRSRPTSTSGCGVGELGDLDEAARRRRDGRARPACGAVDPVPAIADACAAAGAWLHVDAAYAGTAMVCPELRWAFDGRGAGRLAGRQRAQVDADPDGLLAAVVPPPGGPAGGVQPRARVPAHTSTPRTRCRSASTGRRWDGGSAR